MTVADVDFDGKQEIIYAASTIDDDGTVMYNSSGVMPAESAAPGEIRRIGHGDTLHVADIDPDRAGLEIFMVHEGASSVPYGYTMRDAKTGEIIYGAYIGKDTGRGMIGDWREELIIRTADSSALRIFESTSVTDHKLHTLMHDAQYRAQVAGQQTVYNQPDYTSYYFAGDTDFSQVKVLDFWTPLVKQASSGGMLSGPHAVAPGKRFDLNYSLKTTQSDVAVQDITISYDANKLEFIAPPISKDVKKIMVTSYEEMPGKVRIWIANSSDKHKDLNGNLIKLSFQAKQTAEPGVTSIAISKLVNTNSLGEESLLSGSSHEVQIK